ncbi:MAG: hypothetical protein J5I65_12550 [Aridibacter famidurans]|nr:hypothetical protein [Aridibacter famidurans]
MSQSVQTDSIAALKRLGFTELEAAAYAYLVTNSPATAYKVARDIGKPVANTYKAVQSLFEKGAIMIDETENRLCTAVDPDTLLEDLKRSYLRDQARAKDALASLTPASEGEGVYALSKPDQVFATFGKLCSEAKAVILVDAFPGVVKKIAPALEQAAEGGVKIVMQVYRPTEINGVEVIETPDAPRMLDRWKGHWLIAVADGAEYLQAFMSEDLASVEIAHWSKNAFLALPKHNFLANTLRQSALENTVGKQNLSPAMEAEFERTREWTTMADRGYEKLRARFEKGG